MSTCQRPSEHHVLRSVGMPRGGGDSTFGSRLQGQMAWPPVDGLPALTLQASHLASLSLGLVICQMEIKSLNPSQNCV